MAKRKVTAKLRPGHEVVRMMIGTLFARADRGSTIGDRWWSVEEKFGALSVLCQALEEMAVPRRALSDIVRDAVFLLGVARKYPRSRREDYVRMFGRVHLRFVREAMALGVVVEPAKKAAKRQAK